jgi:hypothetical protein
MEWISVKDRLPEPWVTVRVENDLNAALRKMREEARHEE